MHLALTLPLLLAVSAVDRPTVLMVHGAGGGGWEYRFWQEELKGQGWKTLAPDLMPAPAGLAETTLDDYVNQVVKLGKKEGRVVLVGASMGGPIVLRAAASLKPVAIVLVNPVPAKGTPGWPKAPAEFPDVVRWAGGSLKDTQDCLPDGDESVIRWAWKLWRDESGQAMRSLYAGVECPRPSSPVLMVIGREDGDVPPATSRSFAQMLGADVFEYAGMSHVGPLLGKRSREVSGAVGRWLSRRLGEASRH